MTVRVLGPSGAVLAAYEGPRAHDQAKAERGHLVEVHGYAAGDLEVTEAEPEQEE